ncbi:unnamed protein product [Effrenium voratum]|uniref:Protein kinase domain-containing protein n=1 Tax=Effrenium voratum TaxID=2562239 RepID=A0AA36MZF0_9DINO|nr:unnamed protein product [Effrenium voratum]CAJ1437942.1 unnamed protein product [Effrenium voratum]
MPTPPLHGGSSPMPRPQTTHAVNGHAGTPQKAAPCIGPVMNGSLSVPIMVGSSRAPVAGLGGSMTLPLGVGVRPGASTTSPPGMTREVPRGSLPPSAAPLWAAPAAGIRQISPPGVRQISPPPGAVYAMPAAGYPFAAPMVWRDPKAARPTTESPVLAHIRGLGAQNSTPEFQQLLNLVVSQEHAKQELQQRLSAAESELQKQRAENLELQRAVREARLVTASWGGPGSVTSKVTMRSVPEGCDSPLSRTRSGSLRLRRSNSSRARFTDSKVLPFTLPEESLQEKYAVDWQTCLHVGNMNGLQSGEAMTLSRFFKAKLKSNSAQRVIKAVRKSEVPFFRLLEQHIGDQRAFDHPHVCRLHDAFEDHLHVFQIYEFLSGPSLLEKILSDPQFCERDAAAAIKAIMMAVAYLHGLSIAHQNVHLENMRFATQPRKKESGSCYCDQLKLMDVGLSLNRKLIPSILNAASLPSESDKNPSLPLLAPLGFQNSLGSICLPPESQGVCSSYAQLATAAPCMLRSSKSVETLNRSPSLQRGNSQDLSQVSISSLGQDSSARRAQELLLLLQAGDVWSLGCVLHVLLSGQIPCMEDAGEKSEATLPLLSASAEARDLCCRLLHPMPRKRAAAEAALDSAWFAQCENIQRAHRSQKKNLSLAAPRPAEFWEKLRQTSAITCLRRLFHSVRAVRGTKSLAIPGSEEDNLDLESNARAAADAMCAEAFEWLLFSSGAAAASGIPLRKLNAMIQSVVQSEKRVSRQEEILKVDTLISSTQFADMIWATCA